MESKRWCTSSEPEYDYDAFTPQVRDELLRMYHCGEVVAYKNWTNAIARPMDWVRNNTVPTGTAHCIMGEC
jgi:hypothetical protein